MITICNMRGGNWPLAKEHHVRVDRDSVFGNPFALGILCTRDQSCDQYKLHFKNQLAQSAAFRVQIDELVDILERRGELFLYCWCAPKRCHAETIKEYLEYRIECSKK
jgi:hypothetical protein